jgi:hypothetical protein
MLLKSNYVFKSNDGICVFSTMATKTTAFPRFYYGQLSLYFLAMYCSTDLDLQKRIVLLSRAIMCAKSSSSRSSSAVEGEFLHELEEKMEVRLRHHFTCRSLTYRSSGN